VPQLVQILDNINTRTAAVNHFLPSSIFNRFFFFTQYPSQTSSTSRTIYPRCSSHSPTPQSFCFLQHQPPLQRPKFMATIITSPWSAITQDLNLLKASINSQLLRFLFKHQLQFPFRHGPQFLSQYHQLQFPFHHGLRFLFNHHQLRVMFQQPLHRQSHQQQGQQKFLHLMFHRHSSLDLRLGL